MSVLVVLLPWLAAGAASVAALLMARARLRSHLARRAADAARDDAERRLRALAAQAGYGLFAAAADGRLTEANAPLAAMLGHPSPAALLEAGVRVPIAAPSAEGAATAPDAGRDATTAAWADAAWPRADGDAVAVRLLAHTVRDARGRVLGHAGIVEDAGGRLRREAVLRRGEHLASLGRMLAGAAHELNNPLAAVSGFAQLLLRSPMRADERTALETIDHEARRAATIVKDLLTFSRRGAATERRLVDLNAVARYIAGTRRYALETSGVQLALDLADGPLEVLGDGAQLEQIVLNLLTNAQEALDGTDGARAAGDPAPRVVLRTSRLERLALLEVADNGPGIASGDLAMIWEPFFTTKASAEGTGLGLAVVHRLVNDHEGVIDVESEPGAGARFRVVLPLPTAHERDTARPEPAPELAREALDVLVADADEQNADFLARYLRTRGHAVIVARDAAQALRLARGSGFDVVIAAAELAPPDGILLQHVRAQGDGARCVVVTDGGPEADVTAGPGAACAVLARPFQIEQLRRAVEDA